MAPPLVNGVRPMEVGTPGSMRSWLNGLILEGRKTAAAGLVSDYDAEAEPLESEGEILALVDDDLLEVARLRVTGVETVRFADVPWEFAAAEGEGDASIEEWREGHRRFWTSLGESVDHDTLVVLVRFELWPG
ncbi:MAG: ASCH domain-containing protein [Acidimicrobiales bacterium]